MYLLFKVAKSRNEDHPEEVKLRSVMPIYGDLMTTIDIGLDYVTAEWIGGSNRVIDPKHISRFNVLLAPDSIEKKQCQGIR